MNPQPDQSTINFATGIFLLLVAFFALTSKKKFTFSDKIDILYEVLPCEQNIVQYATIVKDPPKARPTKRTSTTQKPPKQNKPPVVNKPVEKPKATVTTTTTTEPPKFQLNKKNFSVLHEDCKNALVNLGMKKGEATETVIRIFNTNEINTIEEFIKKAFAPNEYN